MMPLICDWMKGGGASVTAQGASRRPSWDSGQVGDLLRQPVLVVDHLGRAAHLDDGIVPGRHHLAGLALGLVPGRRHIGIGALEDDQHRRCRIVGDEAPLRIGLGQMSAQPAVRRHCRRRAGTEWRWRPARQARSRSACRADVPGSVRAGHPAAFPGNGEARTSALAPCPVLSQPLRPRIGQFAGQPAVEIVGAFLDQQIGVVGEEVVGAGQRLLRDGDALLRVQLVDQALHVLRRRHLVGIAMDDQARRRAGRQEREIIGVGLRRDRDEAFDLRPAHQKLHADPRAEGIAGDPAALGIRMQRLDPVERRGRVRQFAGAVVEFALAAADAAEIEAQRGEIALLEHVEEVVDDLVVHRAAELRMRMQDDGDRRALFLGGLVAALQATGRTGENDLRHEILHLVYECAAPGTCLPLALTQGERLLRS